jgi:hypothetical protein
MSGVLLACPSASEDDEERTYCEQGQSADYRCCDISTGEGQ